MVSLTSEALINRADIMRRRTEWSNSNLGAQCGIQKIRGASHRTAWQGVQCE